MKMLFSILIALFGVPISLGVMGSRSGFWSGLVALAVSVAPLILTIRGQRARRRYDQGLLAAARDAVGGGNPKYEHVEHRTMIVLNPQTRRVGVSVRGESKVYSFDDVRAWDVRKVSRGGGAVGYGVTGTVAAGSQNIAASMEADRQTGLFLTVRDIDHPEWRISMFSADDRARWAEILRQVIDEGKAGA